MLGLGLGLKIFGLGLEAQVLGLEGQVLRLEAQVLGLATLNELNIFPLTAFAPR